MKIRRLEIQGFKSFADRTSFDFDAGISAIVGPNGCGKSNVVDAIKWVLGDMSPKSLRGKRMEDVIFAGSRTRKPSGLAEVTLVLDNDDGLLKTEHAEVALTRRLYRAGESEYLINGQPARLKDIRELFLDTGLGTEGNSIMEQGQHRRPAHGRRPGPARHLRGGRRRLPLQAAPQGGRAEAPADPREPRAPA